MTNRFKIAGDKIQDIIKDNNLKPYFNTWHYSYNFEIFNQDYELLKQGDTINLVGKALNVFSPAPVFTNNTEIITSKEKNLLLKPYDESNKEYRAVYWFLNTTSFSSFLERKTLTSSNPRKHFPSLYNYGSTRKKINEKINILPLKGNETFFEENFNLLKQAEFYSGKEVINFLTENNKGIPQEWVKIAYLSYEKAIVAIALIVDDNKSISLINIVALRHKLSFGVYLCTEIIQYCCSKNYLGFDACVSGHAGGYKDKLFLDSWDIYHAKSSLFTRIQFKLKKLSNLLNN